MRRQSLQERIPRLEPGNEDIDLEEPGMLVPRRLLLVALAGLALVAYGSVEYLKGECAANSMKS